MAIEHTSEEEPALIGHNPLKFDESTKYTKEALEAMGLVVECDFKPDMISYKIEGIDDVLYCFQETDEGLIYFTTIKK